MKALILLCALLTGCSTAPKWLENRVLCTVAKDEAHVVSKWGRNSIGSQVAERDAAIICGR